MARSVSRRTLLLAAASVSAAAACPGSRFASVKTSAPIAALEAETGGRIGVAALNTGSGLTVRHRADERFPFCSTFKLLAVSAILKASATEHGLLERRIAYAESDLAKYSPITSQHVGKSMTVAAICAAALQYSDNTAANLMIRLLGGPDAVTAFARSIGDERFRLDRWETTLNNCEPGDPRDTTTPAAMMRDLLRATIGDLLGAPERAQLVAWMQGCKTGDKRIRAAIPAGWLVGDKTGSGDYGTTNDVAVVWPPDKAPIVLAIYFTQESKDAPMRDEVIAAAARAVLGKVAD
jgi:beta-lactamase class A